MREATQSAARLRLAALLDADSFVEIGAAVKARNTDFPFSGEKEASDGVVTGFGSIAGKPVYVYSQDPDVLHGSIGEMHAKKIAKIYDLALRTGDPVIGLLDSSGMRLEEGMDALQAFGEIYACQARSSGRIPQISAVFGRCGGGMALLASLSDFLFLQKDKGELFLHSSFPAVLENQVDIAGTEEDIIAAMRDLIDFLPANNQQDIPYFDSQEDWNTEQEELAGGEKDPERILSAIADEHRFVEVQSASAPDLFAAFARLGGFTAGILGNRALSSDDTTDRGYVLSAAGAKKAARLTRFCDAFGIPLVSFTNIHDFVLSEEEETSLPEAASQMAMSFASATMPRINVITGEAYGTPYLLMNNAALGADLTYAWEGASIGMMDASAAAKILSSSPEKEAVQKTQESYENIQNQVASAAARGYVDRVIDPAETRKYLIGALDRLSTKAARPFARKHSSIGEGLQP